MKNNHLKSPDLVPFVDSLRATTASYVYGEPHDAYEYRGRMIAICSNALYHHWAKAEVDFDTYFGEYLALQLDDPPMTDWLDDWKDNVIPGVLENLEKCLQNDKKPISTETITNLGVAARIMYINLEAATDESQRIEFWRLYDTVAPVYDKARPELDTKAKLNLKRLEFKSTVRDIG